MARRYVKPAFVLLVALGIGWWLFKPPPDYYGIQFVKRYLGEATDFRPDSDYPEFCVLPPYFYTKDGTGTDNDRKMTFAWCNEVDCRASVETRFPEYEGRQYSIIGPRRNRTGGISAFCVNDIDHVTVESLNNGRGLILDHGSRAIWEKS